MPEPLSNPPIGESGRIMGISFGEVRARSFPLDSMEKPYLRKDIELFDCIKGWLT